MACSLIVVDGVRKVSDQEAMEFARIAGLKFIRLQHIRCSSGAEYAQRGFQSVTIKVITDRDGGKRYEWEGSKDRFTNEPCMGQRQLLFQPEKFTGLLMADVPDTPFNRDLLVKCYFNNAQWKIVDPELDADIRRKAEEFQKSIPNKPSPEKVVADLAEENKNLIEENRRLKQQLELRSQADEIIKESTQPSANDMTGALGMSIADEKKLREEAKSEVFKEMEVQLKAIQESQGKAWQSSKKYREEILPVVEARYQKKLEERYANNQGVVVNN